MPLERSTIEALARHLDSCVKEVRDTEKLTDQHPEMSWEEAYAIQEAWRALALAEGARLVGFKAGLTSVAKMKQMGVETPVFGFLLDRFAIAEGGEVAAASLIHPRIEPEIAFVMKKRLAGPGVTLAQVLAATDFVIPAIEVIDSRYRDFRFDLKSVIADNTSAARFVLGGRARPVEALDLRTLGVVLSINGEARAFGAGAAVLGHPAAAVAELANHLARRGEALEAGQVVLSGGITEALAVAAGDHVLLEVAELGTVGFRFS
jgi:2-oxo-3-hexenedioate decarboxylase